MTRTLSHLTGSREKLAISPGFHLLHWLLVWFLTSPQPLCTGIPTQKTITPPARGCESHMYMDDSQSHTSPPGLSPTPDSHTQPPYWHVHLMSNTDPNWTVHNELQTFPVPKTYSPSPRRKKSVHASKSSGQIYTQFILQSKRQNKQASSLAILKDEMKTDRHKYPQIHRQLVWNERIYAHLVSLNPDSLA